MHLILKCTEARAFMCPLVILFHLFNIIFITTVSFGSSFVFIPVYMKRFM